MCAIFGIIGTYEQADALNAAHTLSHRGADGFTFFESRDFFWSHRRLAIVDVAHESVLHHEGVYVSFNGEIYNHCALRLELAPFAFQTQSDTEVVLAAFLTWGEAFVEKLDGMFAIALYDGKTLRLYRDRSGKKPLFYLQTPTTFYFASEIKALLPFSSKKHNPQALHNYLAYQTVFAPHTFYADIQSVQPAQMIAYELGVLQSAWYNPIVPLETSIREKKEALHLIEAALQQSVQKRLSHEVECAFLLSGGLDSSVIAAMATRMCNAPIHTYSLGYEEYTRYDERHYAKAVASHIGSVHHEFIFTYEDFVSSVDAVLYHLDTPLNDPAALPLYHLMGHIKKHSHAKIVLSGEGSDELFFGYRPHLELLEIEGLKKLSKKSWLKNYFNAHPSLHREWTWYRRIFNDEVLFRSSLESWSDTLIEKLLSKKTSYKNWDHVAHFWERYDAFNINEDSKWYRYIELSATQSNYFLTKLDRLSSAHTLEARAPFMDAALINTVMRCDSALFFQGQETKHLLKTLAHAYLPASIITRKKKGFSYPYIEWMERMGAFEEMHALNETHRVFNKDALERLIVGAQKGDFKQHVFGLYFYLRWLNVNDALYIMPKILKGCV